MVINLICKLCNKEQMVDIKDIEGENYYKCQHCNHEMCYSDTNRLLNLRDLLTFELPHTYNPTNDSDILLLERIFKKIKSNYYNQSDEIKNKVFRLVDLLDRITEYKEIEPTLHLCEAVEKCYKEIVRKDHEEMSKLLGIDKDKTLSEFYNL